MVVSLYRKLIFDLHFIKIQFSVEIVSHIKTSHKTPRGKGEKNKSKFKIYSHKSCRQIQKHKIGNFHSSQMLTNKQKQQKERRHKIYIKKY